MKWILLVIFLIYCGSNNSTSSKIDTVKSPSSLTNARSARTLGFLSEDDDDDNDDDDDENGIHLHIWNDLTSKKNFYPNLMKHIAEESVIGDTNVASTARYESGLTSNPTQIHVNLNEVLPTPQPQMSAANVLKHALMNALALDEFRKSDQSLYGSLYKLNVNYPSSNAADGWNYHPSAVNYIPKPYNTNLNGQAQSRPSIKLARPLVSAKATNSRPTLRDQMRATRNSIQNYYTNLHMTKPKSVLRSVGYEISGIPKYSGRLLANEPMPQQYRTFKMFEPVPRQIMLPPPLYGIPEFKPVPPRLKIVPVIDEFLEHGNRLVVDNAPKLLPWKSVRTAQKAKPYYIPMMPKPLELIPFKMNEAITMAPIRNYIPKAEPNHMDQTIEANQIALYLPSNITTLQNMRTTKNQLSLATKPAIKSIPLPPPPPTIQLPSQYNAQQLNDLISTYDAQRQDAASKSQPLYNRDNAQPPSDYEYEIHKIDVNSTGFTKSVPPENSRFNFTETSQKIHRPINNSDIVHAAKKGLYKKTKTIHKTQPSQPSDKRTNNDVTNSDVPHFYERASDCSGKDGSASPQNPWKKDCITKSVNRAFALRLETSKSDGQTVLIDRVPSDSIQFSQTYSKHTTNVPQHQTTSSPVQSTQTTKKDQDKQILQQLANDVQRALATSASNGTAANEHDASTSTYDPFLIAVYDENEKATRGDTNANDDLQLAQVSAKTSNSTSSIQRMDQAWMADKTRTIVRPTKRLFGRRTQSKLKTQDKPKTKSEPYNNIKELKLHANSNNNSSSSSSTANNSNNNGRNGDQIDKVYYKWFNNYARDANRTHGRTLISEHFRKVKNNSNTA